MTNDWAEIVKEVQRLMGGRLMRIRTRPEPTKRRKWGWKR